jgi:hypothetical protein
MSAEPQEGDLLFSQWGTSGYKVLHPRRHKCCLEDRVSKLLWNDSTYFYVPDYTVAYPKNAISFILKVESTGLSKILVCFPRYPPLYPGRQ